MYKRQQPDTARLLLSDGTIREVRVGALRPGEAVQLLAGDRIPVDGVVLEGASAVDVSSLTGEPLPLQAEPGTELSSGSLNLESTLALKVTRVGAETPWPGSFVWWSRPRPVGPPSKAWQIVWQVAFATA